MRKEREVDFWFKILLKDYFKCVFIQKKKKEHFQVTVCNVSHVKVVLHRRGKKIVGNDRLIGFINYVSLT